MKSASFFFLSVTLHVAALVYPVEFAGHNHSEAISVTLLPREPAWGGEGGSGGSGNSEPKDKSNSRFAARSAIASSLEAKPVNSTPKPPIVAAEKIETVSESSVALIAANMAPPESNANTTIAYTKQTTQGAAGTGGIGTGGNGLGAGAGSGGGTGAELGSGSGESGSGLALTQARYRDTPRPEYPDSARRQGREGRVLLRVLVDDQGRSKQVEINRSSGSDALDRAAAEAMRRWRFHPARHGDTPIESWLRVPIEFRLEETNR